MQVRAAIEQVELTRGKVVLIAPEELVCTLPIEKHRRVVLAGKAHHRPLKVDRRREERLFLMAVNALGLFAETLWIRRHGKRTDPGRSRDDVDLRAFGQRRVAVEPARERVLRE